MRCLPDGVLDNTSPANRHESYGTYLTALGGVALGLVALFGLGLAALGRSGLLPPPQLSNNLCVDQKLSYLREHTITKPTILTVGSSVAWRGIDSKVVREATEDTSMPLNGAFCGLKLNQTEFTARYLLTHYPSVRSVLLVLAPHDLAECSTTNARVFDPKDVDDFVFRHDIRFGFYLKYFDPFTLAKNALILRSIRKGRLPFETMSMNRYGDAPLDIDASRGLVYAAVPPFDPDCLSSLRKLATEVTDQGRRFIVVTMPISPLWKAWYDPSGADMQELTRRVHRAIAGTGAMFWDANHELPMDPSDFIDAIHIRWSAAKVFSEVLVLATGLGIEPSGLSYN